MRRVLSGLVLVAAALAPVVLPAETTVKKADGTAIKGKIQGLIVQREELSALTGYTFRRGSDVTAIDEDGVHAKKGSPIVYLPIGKSSNEKNVLAGTEKVNQLVIRGESQAAVDNAELVGQFDGTVDPQVRGTVRAVITVETKSGRQEIEVRDLVAFRKPAQ